MKAIICTNLNITRRLSHLACCLLFYFQLPHVFAASAIAADSTAYYLGSSTIAQGIPQGAPPMQGVRQTYLIQTPSETVVPVPVCPPNYVPQVYAHPVGFSGGRTLTNTAYSASPMMGVQPLYGVSAYARPQMTNNVLTGWKILLFSLQIVDPLQAKGDAGLQSSPTFMAGFVSVITQCCNPNDPASKQCKN